MLSDNVYIFVLKQTRMKIKLIVYFVKLVCFVSCITSCDTAYPLLVDGNPEKQLSCDRGRVVLRGSSSLSDVVAMDCDGYFTVQLDSLIIKHPRKYSKDVQVFFYLNDSLIDNQQSFQLSGKNRLSVRLIADYPLHYGRTGAIELLPSDFILCGGNPIITDTIRFEKKAKINHQGF